MKPHPSSDWDSVTLASYLSICSGEDAQGETVWYLEVPSLPPGAPGEPLGHRPHWKTLDEAVFAGKLFSQVCGDDAAPTDWGWYASRLGKAAFSALMEKPGHTGIFITRKWARVFINDNGTYIEKRDPIGQPYYAWAGRTPERYDPDDKTTTSLCPYLWVFAFQFVVERLFESGAR